MTVVGAYVRLDVASAAAVCRKLGELKGVSTFELDEPGKAGVLIEADDLDQAHAMLQGDIRRTSGVLGAWPVYAHFGAQDDQNDDETNA